MGEIAFSFEYGLNAAAKKYDGENKYIRITDIDDDTHEFLSDSFTSPDIDLTGAENYKLAKGDILFARTGASVGKSYIYRDYDGLVYYAGFLIRARIKDEYDAEFVFQNTLTDKYNKYIAVTSQRSGQPGVNAQEYAEFKIQVPQKEEQIEIGKYFRDIDHLITLHQWECNINENTAIYGGAISLEKATVNITGGYIDSNVATEGGGCHVRNGGKLNITDGNFMNNTATEGAGVYAYGNNEYNRVIVTISGNTEIMNNIATGNGGGIGTKDYVTINLSDGMVRDNEALNGGGVYMDNTNTNVNLSNCFIGGNRVRGNGGGIYHNGNLDVSEIVQIYGNKCMTSDGETASNNNVYLTSGKTITNNSGELSNDSYIYVTVIDKENAFTGVFNEDLSDRIVSDDKAYVVVYDATSKTYGLAQAVCITLDPKNEYEGPVECYIQKGTVFSKPEYEPMYDNYRFIGWYKDGVRYDFSKVVNEDIILTAEWIKSDSAPVELTKEGYAVSGVTCSGTLYIASYGEKELISAKAVPVNGDVKGTFADIGLDTTGAISISAYLWENNMAPLSETVSIKLNS